MSRTRAVSRRHLVPGGLLAGLALTAGGVSLGAPHLTAAHADPVSGPRTPTTFAQAVATPSLVAPPRRASRGGARTALPPVRSVSRVVAVGPTFSGYASWYGPAFQGHRTADGEVFDTRQLTAASRTLPFGTRLRVCRRAQCVTVRVNDRGPFVSGRVLDLTQAARDALGSFGVAWVTATPVGTRQVTVAAPPVLASAAVAPHPLPTGGPQPVLDRESPAPLVVRQAALTRPAWTADGMLGAGVAMTSASGLTGLRRRRRTVRS